MLADFSKCVTKGSIVPFDTCELLRSEHFASYDCRCRWSNLREVAVLGSVNIKSHNFSVSHTFPGGINQ